MVSLSRSRLTALLLLGLTSVGAVASTALSEPVPAEKRGRLPDGRAYRTDSQGYRLVDQIAELEVENDDLRRQVQAMENEIAILRAQNPGNPAPAPLTETNLLPPSAGSAASAAKEPPDCNELVSGLSMKVARLERQLQAAPSQSQQVVAAACDYDSPSNPLWTRVTELQEELMRGPSKEGFLKERARREEVEEELAQTRLAAERASRSGEALEEKIEKLEEQLASAQEALGAQRQLTAKLEESLERESEAAASAESSARAAMRAAAANERNSAARRAAASARAPSTPPAEIARMQRELKGELSEVQSLILKRKNLLDSVKQRKRGVSISIRPLVTANGRSLDTLRLQAKNLKDASAASQLRLGIGEISAILKDDIAVLERLSRG